MPTLRRERTVYRSSLWRALRITLTYAVFGLLWIFFSDQVATSVAPTREALAQIQNLKGYLYIVFTATLLFAFIRWELSRALKAEAKADQMSLELAELNRQLEERVETRTRELQLTNDELRRFSHSISHDLRSPLRAMSGFAYALAEDYGDRLDAEGQDYVVRIQSSAKRADEMITGLLALANVHQVELKLVTVDVAKLAEEAISELRRRYPEREIVINMGKEICVIGDLRLMRTLVDNLIRNAWKYTELRKPAYIAVEAIPNGFQVVDDGIGFDSSQSEDLFREFYRLPEAAGYSGMGIGLATVKRIVEKHRGSIEAFGKPNEGATFRVTFPADLPVTEKTTSLEAF